MNTGTSLIGALAISAAYIIGAIAGRINVRHKRAWLSFASGVSIAYVFVDVLPELEVQRQVMLQGGVVGALFAEKRIYLFALLGLLFFYGIGQLSAVHRRNERQSSGGNGQGWAFVFHIAGFVLYNMVIGYLLWNRAAASHWALPIFVFAMALHIIVLDGELAHEYGKRYARRGRWALAAGVPLGWLLGATGGIPEPLFSRLFAFIAGGIVITSAAAEIPAEKEGRYWYFVLGAAVYAFILLFA